MSTALADRGVVHGRALAPALTFIALVVAVIGNRRHAAPKPTPD